ncbi:FkbM family methyltransferase [Methylobacterium marchantiae]|uniref:FkbM family methyltransferase n=1 Tax=Methylobacterium marchantiae TaxID=600331 RepID=A0ABW3WX60_9HYPH|nr:hypothetical protein AIGOOFII_0091 [Methylobacterium marchantiae]
MFLSYAQNFEDVLLWRALKGVERGFYVDVGANDPTEDSVTLAFYKRGWHGLNIEPNDVYHRRLTEARPRDINLKLGCGPASGESTFFVVDKAGPTGLSTMRRDHAEQHERDGFTTTACRIVIEPLAALLDAHAPPDIHFLKIDVEGAEREVLLGTELTRHRPWIVLLEAIDPANHAPNHEEWEPILVESGYRYVWFDGLNRYYVSEEKHDDLKPHFQTPLNLFDRYGKVSTAGAASASDGIVRSAKLAAREAGPEAADLARLILNQAILFRSIGQIPGALVLLEFGAEFYPAIHDASRHPIFLKELVRTHLLDPVVRGGAHGAGPASGRPARALVGNPVRTGLRGQRFPRAGTRRLEGDPRRSTAFGLRAGSEGRPRAPRSTRHPGQRLTDRPYFSVQSPCPASRTWSRGSQSVERNEAHSAVEP